MGDSTPTEHESHQEEATHVCQDEHSIPIGAAKRHNEARQQGTRDQPNVLYRPHEPKPAISLIVPCDFGDQRRGGCVKDATASRDEQCGCKEQRDSTNEEVAQETYRLKKLAYHNEPLGPEAVNKA